MSLLNISTIFFILRVSLRCTKEPSQILSVLEVGSWPKRDGSLRRNITLRRWHLFWKGRPITEVAADLGINAGTLGNWVAAWHEDNPEHS